MKKGIVKWLRGEFSSVSEYIVLARVFGSVARGTSAPSDCDVLIVTNAEPDARQWKELREHIKIVRARFLIKYRLPLSVVLMTVGESVSTSRFVRALKPYIDIQL